VRDHLDAADNPGGGATDIDNGPISRPPRGDGMSKILRGLAAGWGAKRMGGGCISTVLIFLLLWWLLGHFNLFK
jgi:hypothetical protein